MVWESWAAVAGFFGVSAIVICTPGPDTALTIRNALAGGRAGGVRTAAGVAVGQAVWTLAAALGITGLVVASETAYLVLRLAGAAYLIYLGAHSVLAAVRDRGSEPGKEASAHWDGSEGSGGSWFIQGLVNDVANPKMAAFFMSLLPQFAGADAALGTMMALGLTFALMTFGWLVAYSIAVNAARALIAKTSVKRVMDGLAGSVLLALGLRVALTGGRS
jgi:threonine/homoserine/homoserine lactone efflux protein